MHFLPFRPQDASAVDHVIWWSNAHVVRSEADDALRVIERTGHPHLLDALLSRESGRQPVRCRARWAQADADEQRVEEG